jgi:hypothetical protein
MRNIAKILILTSIVCLFACRFNFAEEFYNSEYVINNESNDTVFSIVCFPTHNFSELPELFEIGMTPPQRSIKFFYGGIDWSDYLKDYHEDSLYVLIAGSDSALLKWDRKHDDSLLLQKNKYGRKDVDRTRITITYGQKETP